MHAKDAFWISLFFKDFFSGTIIVISRVVTKCRKMKRFTKNDRFSHTFLKSKTKISKQILNMIQ